jgi:hypothetical protein
MRIPTRRLNRGNHLAMMRKALAVLLVLSWMILSGVDMLEDLDSDSRATASGSSSPANAKKPVKLANDNVELANRTFVSFEKLFVHRDLTKSSLTLLDPDSRVPRSYKDNCVFLI